MFYNLRHINSSVTQKIIGLNVVIKLEKYYDDPIIVIDDNSNPELLMIKIAITSSILKIIYSEFGYCHGEILPYYYLHKNYICLTKL